MGKPVVVLGGGPNGLVSAAYLARAGRSVTVLEARETLGGLAAAEEFHPGFRAPGIHHDTSTISTRVIEDLELARHGLVYEARRSPLLLAEEDGPGLMIGGDPEATRAELARTSPKDAERFAAYHQFHTRIAGFLEGLVASPPPDIADPNVLELAFKAVGLRRLGKKDMLEFLRIAPMCIADWLNEWFESDLLKAGLSGYGVFGAFLGPWSAGTNLNLLLWEHASRVHVPGGGARWVEALASAARQAGAELRTGARVVALERGSDGGVSSIELASGERIPAGRVLSTLDPKTTVGLFERIPQRLSEQVGIFRCAGTTAILRLALQGSCEFTSRAGEPIAAARTGGSIDQVERAFDALKYGEFSQRPILDIQVPSVEDASLCPEGHSVVSVQVHFAPHALRAGWTDDQRSTLKERALAELDRVAPGTSARVVAHELLTPVDIEQRYGVTGGHIHHGEHALDQRFLRPTPETARYATPIAGLFLGGGGSHPGGGLTGEPGRMSAQVLLKS